MLLCIGEGEMQMKEERWKEEMHGEENKTQQMVVVVVVQELGVITLML